MKTVTARKTPMSYPTWMRSTPSNLYAGNGAYLQYRKSFLAKAGRSLPITPASVKPTIRQWMDKHDNTTARKQLTQWLPKTIGKGALSTMHPLKGMKQSQLVVYRGQDHYRGPRGSMRSWTTSLKVAKGFAGYGGSVYVSAVSTKTAAFDISKGNKAASKRFSEKEVAFKATRVIKLPDEFTAEHVKKAVAKLSAAKVTKPKSTKLKSVRAKNTIRPLKSSSIRVRTHTAISKRGTVSVVKLHRRKAATRRSR